jgi:hypothetical protein
MCAHVIDRTFTVASDTTLVDLIRRANRRLVVVAPAVTDAVAEAIVARLPDLGLVSITLILDTDPEVYRLGYGTPSALEKLRAASTPNMLDLREQRGVRIGVVISDDRTMIFAPAPMLIEAGSTAAEKPNAIVLDAAAAEKLAVASGAGKVAEPAKQEVGVAALEPEVVQRLQQNLKSDPPQAFDVARKLRVFSSAVQYVELEVSNYRLSTKQIQLPPELIDITDDELRQRVTSRIRTPIAGLGPFKVRDQTPDGEKEIEISERWLTEERMRIEKEYTVPIPRFGRVILITRRQKFDAEIGRFKRLVLAYCAAVVAEVETVKESFVGKLVAEYLPRWIEHPPQSLLRYIEHPTQEDIKQQLRRLAVKIFEKAVKFDRPDVQILYKNIAPESVRDPAFLDPLHKALLEDGAPQSVMEALFHHERCGAHCRWIAGATI